MISVEEAHRIISEQVKDFGIEEIALEDGIGRILREPITADRDFPPFDRVAMDGIAIRYGDFENGTRSFKISGVAAAGAPRMTLTNANECLEVMTGAIMPDGLDTVIPYEKIDIQEDTATLTAEDTTHHQQNIHFKGLDRTRNEVIIHPGKQLSSSEIGVCATVGKATIKVSRLPKTIVISSGDELVEIDQTPESHQIRRSNVYRLKTALQHYHVPVDTAHLVDDYDAIVEKLRIYLEEYEVIMLSGGVSKGKYDYLPEALESLGVQKHFHRIAQRPGKPFWFGSTDHTTVFAFPGNPVSSFICMQNYFKTWLDQCVQMESQPIPVAVLGSDVTFAPDITYFLEVKLDYSTKGELLALPVKGNGSGDLANLVDADAFIRLPRGKNEFLKGEAYPIIPYR